MKTCPKCAEDIKDAAKVCPHCRYKFSAFELMPAETRSEIEAANRRQQPLAWVVLLAIALAVARCAFTAADNKPPITIDDVAPAPVETPSVIIEDNTLLGGVYVTIEADTTVSGQRPTIVLVCERNKPPSFQLYLKHAPATPPPLRGVYGSFKADDRPSQRIELGWLTNDTWVPGDQEKKSAAKLVRRIVSAKSVQFQPPRDYSNGDPIEWSGTTFAPRLAAIKRECT